MSWDFGEARLRSVTRIWYAPSPGTGGARSIFVHAGPIPIAILRRRSPRIAMRPDVPKHLRNFLYDLLSEYKVLPRKLEINRLRGRVVAGPERAYLHPEGNDPLRDLSITH